MVLASRIARAKTRILQVKRRLQTRKKVSSKFRLIQDKHKSQFYIFFTNSRQPDQASAERTVYKFYKFLMKGENGIYVLIDSQYTVICFISTSAKIWHLHNCGSKWDTCLS